MRRWWKIGAAFLAFAVLPVLARAQERVADTLHNLSASGPGTVRSVDESQVCIFCHAPHHTSGVRPLWNRELPATNYTIYRSSTLDAKPGQPTGSSKLCLSCHDGTIALGSVLSRQDRIRMAGGDFLPAGLSNLGTDLSDDHPISFHYTAGVAASDAQLAYPTSLPPEVRLDSEGQLQCTSCHDPHNNRYGDFLVMDDASGRLCIACHVLEGWNNSSHRNASFAMPRTAAADWPYPSMAENACRTCHRPHTAGGRARLLVFAEEEANCLECHDGEAGGTNILAELNKTSAHDPRKYDGEHDPRERPGSQREHVECTDCHSPHAASPQSDGGGYVPIGATLDGAPGITIAGAPIDRARYEYEVCFRCHAEAAVQVRHRIGRQADTTDLRLKFATGNPSFHPVAAPARTADSVSLVPGLATGSMIRCTDCHNSDTRERSAGGRSPGPHGSIHAFLLERNYTTADTTTESEYDYAICYKCHLRTSILNDESFKGHRLHVVEQNTPCSACHDPHGITTTVAAGGGDHTHLINFDVLIVRPNPANGRMEFRDTGRFSGSCTLVCHGRAHTESRYGD